MKHAQEIPLTEDLMKEHGLLKRILLIYEECIKKINNHEQFSALPLNEAVEIIKYFIEDYHEKMEEEYLFPLFIKHNKEVELVKILKEQHLKGREVTARVRKMLNDNHPIKDKGKVIASLLQQFIDMYRPHEAREDTELFPLVRSLMSEKEFEALGEKMDKLEDDLFGQGGFELLLERVATIEKELGIYNLEEFTPHIRS